MKNFFGPGLILIALGLTPALQAQNYCTVAQTRGTYTAEATGAFFFLPPPLPAGPTTRIGRVENDGKGGVTVYATTSIDGLVFSEQYNGFLTVNPDCTSVVTFLIPLPGYPDGVPFEFRGVLSDNFKQHDIILHHFGPPDAPIPPYSTVTISLRALARTNCSVGDLSGGYMVNMRGTIDLFTATPAPFDRLGRVVFDGHGNFTAATYYSTGTGNGGNLTVDNFTGTYTMTSHCEFTMSASNGDTWFGVLGDNGLMANVMVSVPNPPPLTGEPAFLGEVVAGTLKRQ